jgi:arylsulfatase A-like enzyme
MNIILVLIDALRADHLSCYGYPKRTSPNIDSIAKRGVLFENAVSPSNWTLPSIYSIITGKYPSTLKIAWWDQKISERFTVFPEVLAEHGYHTGLFTPFKALLNPQSFCSHFKETRQVKVQDNIPLIVKDWVDRHDDSFLFLHVGEYVHEPYFAERKYVSLFLDESIDPEKMLASPTVDSLTSRSSAFKNIRKLIAMLNTRRIRLTRDQMKYLLAAYDAGIFTVDDIVGRMHEAVRERGKDYFFIISADHGQAFMEHGVFGHGLTLYDELIHVPLIFDLNGGRSCRIPDAVQLMDLCPTILDLLEIPRQDGFNCRSLLPLLDGGSFPGRGCIAESYPFISLRKSDCKLITKHTKLANRDEIFNPVASSWKKRLLTRFLHYLPDKLYHLDTDPGERKNMARKDPKRYRALLAEVNEISKNFNVDSHLPVEVGIDEEIKKQLVDLGYM